MPDIFEVWLAMTPAGFAPRAWTDNPLKAVLVTSMGTGSLDWCKGVAQGFNDAELAKPITGARGRPWVMVLEAGRGRPGLSVVVRPGNVDPGRQNPGIHPRARVRPRTRDLNRNGFPWPIRTECYHATAATREIRNVGFKTREEGAPETLGGRWKKSVSFTLSLPRAASIALGLETLILGASRRMSCSELLMRLLDEIPGAFPDCLIQGNNLQDVVWEGEKHGLDAVESVFPVFERLDQGWSAVTIFDKDAPAPRDGEPVSPRTWLVPPGDTSGFDYVTDFQKLFFETYRSALYWASVEQVRQAFNPHFTGTDMSALGKKDPRSVGVIVAKVAVPRVCTDAQGAVRLGYVDAYEMRERREIVNMLQTAELSCRSALEGGDDYEVERGRRPLDLHRWFAPRIGGYEIVEEGSRGRRDTMLFHNREEELIVFATDRIRVDDVIHMPELRRQLGLGDRITYPWFDDDAVDVRVV